jgi:hypothetical protein
MASKRGERAPRVAPRDCVGRAGGVSDDGGAAGSHPETIGAERHIAMTTAVTTRTQAHRRRFGLVTIGEVSCHARAGGDGLLLATYRAPPRRISRHTGRGQALPSGLGACRGTRAASETKRKATVSRKGFFRTLVGDLLHVRPAPGSRWVALRASTTVLLAMTVLAVLGRLELAAYAAFGAFASVYGGPERSATRWRVQSLLAVLLFGAVLSGSVIATLDDRRWLAVPLTAGWAVVASRMSLRERWRPPGPLFLVFASATCASIPTKAPGIVVACGVAASTALVAVLLGRAEVVLLGPEDLQSSDTPATARESWRLPVGCGLATVVAGAAATGAGLAHPSWAMVAAVVPLSVAPLRRQLVRGLHRIAGTAAGLLLAALLLTVGDLPVLALVLVVTALQAAAELLVARHYGVALVFITPLALLLTQVADPLPAGALLESRIVETVLGVLVGLAVAVLTQPAPKLPSRNARRVA